MNRVTIDPYVRGMADGPRRELKDGQPVAYRVVGVPLDRPGVRLWDTGRGWQVLHEVEGGRWFGNYQTANAALASLGLGADAD